MTQIRLGLIGAGGIARAHLASAKALNNVKIVAVADPRAEAAQAMAHEAGARAFDSAVEMLQEGADLIDAVVVCTPPNSRVPIVRQALESGIAVMCEKPLAHTLEDALKLQDLAEGFPSVPTAVGYCHRFTPAVVEMKKRLADGDLGHLVRFENVFACNIPGMSERWMSDRTISGGGSFLDTGCHSLDLCQFVCGETTVVGSVYTHCWPGRGESNATVLVRAGQAGGVICSGWAEAARFIVEIVGTEASLRYDYANPTQLIRTPVDGSAEILTVETHEVRFERQLQAFADVVGGKPRGVLCDFGDAVAVNREAARSAELAGEEAPRRMPKPMMAAV